LSLQKYRFKFYLNAVHAIEINGEMGQQHPHTWELGIDALKSDESFIMFTDIEKGVEELISVYQNKSMNHVPPFHIINPTLENVTIYLNKILKQYLFDRHWFLTKLEVSETPSRSFFIEVDGSDDTTEEKYELNEEWHRTIEKEAEKFLEGQKNQASFHTEEKRSYSLEEIKEYLEKERKKIIVGKFVLSGLVLLGFIITLLVLTWKILR